jgi:hypothetical protein
VQIGAFGRLQWRLALEVTAAGDGAICPAVPTVTPSTSVL